MIAVCCSTAGASLGGGGWMAAKCGFGCGRLSMDRRIIISSACLENEKEGERTTFVDDWFILYVLRAHCKAVIAACQQPPSSTIKVGPKTHLSVLRVSCRNFTPGARLQMRRQTEFPPSASCRMRVSFELRYGMRDYFTHEHHIVRFRSILTLRGKEKEGRERLTAP